MRDESRSVRLPRDLSICGTATFDLSQPTVSHHLKILREAGLVESEGRGTWAYYRIVPEALSRLGEVFSTPNAIER